MRRRPGNAAALWLLVPALVLAACGQHLRDTGAAADTALPRAGAAMAFDVRSGQLVLFGGGADRSLGDTRVWQAGGWQQLSPRTAPPARENAALAYDAGSGLLVLFGGDSVSADGTATRRTDTWTWDGQDWTQRHPPHHPPSGVQPHMAYDQARGVLLLATQPCQCGATSPPPSLSPLQTWTWRAGDWHAESAADAPLAYEVGVGGRTGLPGDGSARPTWGGPDFSGSADMAWDPASRRVLYVEHVVDAEATVPKGGMVTWSWDGAWHLERPATPPADVAEPLLAGDGAGTVLLDGTGHTWHWDGRTWTALPVSGPPQRGAAAMAYDAAAHAVRLFGGIAAGPGGVYADTWTWDGTAWTRSAGPAQAQAVPQPEAVKPATGVSERRAIEAARKSYPEGSPAVTRVENGPLSRFNPGSASGAIGRKWVWAIVYGGALTEPNYCGPSGGSCPPPAHGVVVIVDYSTGAAMMAVSPAPPWLLADPGASP